MNAHSARVGRGRGLEVAAADCVTNDRKQVRKPPVVGNRKRLEEEVRKAPRRPRLDVGVLGVESIATGILALAEELQSFNAQSATIYARPVLFGFWFLVMKGAPAKSPQRHRHFRRHFAFP